MALAAPMGQVYAVECDADACALVRQNQAKFAASNLTLIAGKAPEALQNLPAPDAVFIGGSKGNMQAIVDAALASATRRPGSASPPLHWKPCSRALPPWPAQRAGRTGDPDRGKPAAKAGGQPAPDDGQQPGVF